MKALKAGQKYCPECKHVNPIRCFNCQKCNFAYPQKEKPPGKEKKPKPSNNKKLDDFLKMSGSNLFENKGKDKNGNFKKNLEIKESEPENNKDSVQKLIRNVITHKKNLLSLYNYCDESNNIADKYFNFNHMGNEILITFKNFDLGKNYSSDYIKISDHTLFAVIAYYNTELQKIIINCSEFKIEKKDDEIDSSSEIKFNFPQVVNFTTKLDIISDNDNYLKFSVKLLNISNHSSNRSEQFFLFTLNNTAIIFLFSHYELTQIDKITIKEYINKIDGILSKDGIIKIIIADYDNRILLYANSINNLLLQKFQFISIYEPFTQRITDLQFLQITESIGTGNADNKEKNFFCACSRDGTLKIYDTVNFSKAIFSYKSLDLWVTKFNFDKTHNILYHLVNTSPQERIVAIKFFHGAEYSLKRVPNSEDTLHCQPDEVTGRVYYLTTNGEIKFLYTAAIDMILKKPRAKTQKNTVFMPNKVFHYGVLEESIINEEDKERTVSLDKSNSIIGEEDIKISNTDIKILIEEIEKPEKVKESLKEINPQNQTTDPINNNISHLDYYSSFYIQSFIHKVGIKSKENRFLNQLLVIPCSDKISINLISKKIT